MNLGGENVLPFYTFDAPIENAPKVGVEITDFGLENEAGVYQEILCRCCNCCRDCKESSKICREQISLSSPLWRAEIRTAQNKSTEELHCYR